MSAATQIAEPVAVQQPAPQLYRRFTQKPQIRLSRQNLHIATQFEQANAAVIELLKRGMTVLTIHIEGSRPVIEVEECKAALEMPNTLHTLSIGGVRIFRRIALLNDCSIVWISYQGETR